MRTPFSAILAIAGLSFLHSPVVHATEPVLVHALQGAAVEPLATLALDTAASPSAAASQPMPPDDGPFAAPVGVDALDALRGGTDNVSITTNVSDLDGRVDGNTATGVVTGGNLVDGGAFGSAAGISTVIQNSGNNVLIQNSTIVNVQFVPTP